MVNQKLRIKLKSYDHRILDQSVKRILETALTSGAKVKGPVPLPTRRSVYTVLRSPHVDKDSREQFEIRIHKRLIDIYDPSPDVTRSLMNIDLPAGVDIELKL